MFQGLSCLKNRIEISKNVDGRIEEGQIFFGERKILHFSNDWDDEGFLRTIKFDGQKKDLPTATELYWLMNEKFIESIGKIGVIKSIEEISKIGSPLRTRDSLLGASQIGLDGKNPQGHPHINEFYSGMMGHAFPNWQTDIDLQEFWNENGMRKPVGASWLNAYSRKVFAYPIVIVNMEHGLGDIAGLSAYAYDYFCGLERADGVHLGIATWVNRRDAPGIPQKIYAVATMGGSERIDLDVTSLLPADYKTAGYFYGVKINRNNIQFWHGVINVSAYLTAIAILAPGAPTYSLAGPPYAVGIGSGYLPTHMPVLVEVVDADLTVERTMPMIPRWLRATDGDPCCPEIFRLYATGTNNLLAGSVLAAGSVTSHPFPTFGYTQKTLQFQANQTGSLTIEVLGMSGNWRTYPGTGFSTVANVLAVYGFPIQRNGTGTPAYTDIQGMPVLARVKFTPGAYPCTIAEADVFLA